MSIKAIHIIFITLAILLSLFFGIWSINFSSSDNAELYRWFGFASLSLTFALIVYGIYFLKKIKSL